MVPLEDEKNKIYAAVCVYNQSIEEAKTCIYLKNIVSDFDVSVIIIDNSTKSYGNYEQCRNYGWTYLPMGGNVGISKAYNRTLDYLKEKKGVVVWLDDDTNITPQYFKELKDKLKSEDAEIYVPVIIGQNGKVHSPNEVGFIKNKQLKNPFSEINLLKLNAINSCTAVRLIVYENYRYDEALFLDQVDHDFFADQRKLGKRFCKLNAMIYHDFSVKGIMSLDETKTRYSIMIPDFLTFYKKTKFKIGLGYMRVLKWGIKLTFIYKKNMVAWCIDEANKWRTSR